MSITTITSVGPIVNDVPQDGASNPWECHDFTYQVLFEETIDGVVDFESHISWTVEGYMPIGLDIDIATGLITGNITPLNYQHPEIVTLTPVEKLKLDGSNYANTGRPVSATYDFTFTIIRTYEIKTYLEIPGADGLLYEITEEITNSDVTITVIKNNDIDNLLYITKYLEALSSVVDDEEVEHTIQVNGVSYNFDTLQECLDIHPGPFGNCDLTGV